MQDVAPNRPVGGPHEYSNPNYNALGLIVEEVSGQPYAEYVEQHKLAPLDMRHSMRHSFATPESEGHGELAAGHQWFFGVPLATPDRFIPGQADPRRRHRRRDAGAASRSFRPEARG